MIFHFSESSLIVTFDFCRSHIKKKSVLKHLLSLDAVSNVRDNVEVKAAGAVQPCGEVVHLKQSSSSQPRLKSNLQPFTTSRHGLTPFPTPALRASGCSSFDAHLRLTLKKHDAQKTDARDPHERICVAFTLLFTLYGSCWLPFPNCRGRCFTNTSTKALNQSRISLHLFTLLTK